MRRRGRGGTGRPCGRTRGGGGGARGVCLEKCRLWGTKPQVLKGQAQRPGVGRRKQDRGEAQVRSCPRRGAPRGRTAEGGTGQRRPGGGGRAGQAPEKPLPSATHLEVQTASESFPALPLSGRTLLRCRVTHCPPWGVKPTRAVARVSGAGLSATKQTFGHRGPPRPFLSTVPFNCSFLFGAGCSLETAASSGPGAHFLCFALGPK